MSSSKLSSSVLTALILVSTQSLGAQQAGSPETEKEEQEAQQAPQGTITEEIVVSANLIETPSEGVGSSVTVIGPEEIERRKKTVLMELLRTVPGLELSQNGGPGKTAGIFVRGGSTSHTLVLVDGIRINSPTVGSLDFSDLTIDNIERIEIVRGPQSVLYGSEAVAGAISIVTKRGQRGFHFRAEAEAGDDSFSQFRVNFSGGNDKIDYSFSASDLSTDGVSAASERAGNTEDDPYDNTTFSGRFGLNFLDDGRVDLTIRSAESDTSVDGFTFGIGPTDDLNSTQARDLLIAALTVKKSFASWWNQTFTIGLTDDDLLGEDPDNFFSNFAIDTRLTQFTSQSDFTLSATDTLSLGYTVEKREGDNRGNFEDSVYLRSVFLENQWSWNERFYLTTGVRNDDHSEFGEETTFRISAALLFPQSDTRLHGSFGTGFRAPTFNELFFPFFGNPDLRPETSEGFDLGIEQGFLDDRFSFDVTYFDNDFEDLIAFDLAVFLANNIVKARAEGFEITMTYDPKPGFHLIASHTYTDTEDLTTGLQLARRPKNRSTLYFDLRPIQRLTATLSLIAVSDRIDSDGSDMDDYERVDLAFGYQISERLQPYLRVENLFDESYEEINGFTTPGFTAAIGLRFDL